ncbi:hypothetical protein [Desulfobacula sp.]|uniref:Uncharacterized protein n=1 Tax=Candidatus Desulfatibia vada TaxID=2841696 RepID=A0A8J6NU40_9BACT|nr:hypothetical protein [Candidatus Desulfatibia vada]MBL6994157.1 hypothetical protein [Desulfobacula sp.]
MMSITAIFSEGRAIFGVLFPALFVLALVEISIILYEFLCRVGGVGFAKEDRYRFVGAVEGVSNLATLFGSLQTIISLCLVGFSLLFGTLEVGAKAFALLIQGFASTGFGIATVIVGRSYLQLFYSEELRTDREAGIDRPSGEPPPPALAKQKG